jgi:hypothetical protein
VSLNENVDEEVSQPNTCDPFDPIASPEKLILSLDENVDAEESQPNMGELHEAIAAPE